MSESPQALPLHLRYHLEEEPFSLTRIEERQDMRVLRVGGGLDFRVAGVASTAATRNGPPKLAPLPAVAVGGVVADVEHTMVKRLIRLLPLLGTVACTLGEPPPAASQQDARGLSLSGPVTYFIAEGSPGSGFEDADRTLAEWALEAWGRQASPPLAIRAGPEESATIRVYWVSAAAGLYGEMRTRLVDGRPVAEVFVSPETDGLGPGIADAAREDPLFRDTVVYLTCVHELGHALGLGHTDAFADIMYSFQYGGDFVAYFMRFRDQIEAWEDIRQASPFSPADREALRSLYGSDGSH